MKQKTFAILGSIASKNAIKLLSPTTAKLIHYIPKISLASLHSKAPSPTAITPVSTSIDSFSKDIVLNDTAKAAIEKITSSKLDYIVIDFLDEATEIIYNPKEDVYLTKSNYLLKCHPDLPKSADWVIIKRDSPQGWEYWEIGLKFLLNRLDPTTKIVLLRIKQPRHFISQKNREPILYSEKYRNQIDKNNQQINQCHTLISNYAQCIEIETDHLVTASQTDEVLGFNPTDIDTKTLNQIAKQIEEKLNLPHTVQATVSERINSLFDIFSPILKIGDVPTIMDLYNEGKKHLIQGEQSKAKQCEQLIKIIHNSSVPLTAKIGKVSFGYGGIAVVIHGNCEIGDYVVIGSNVTLGGGKSRPTHDGKLRQVPIIEDRVYIATGAKLLGGIKIGKNSIIGANSVVTTDIPPLSVVAGNPAKIINKISPDNFRKYASYLYKNLSAEEAKEQLFSPTNTTQQDRNE